MRVFEEIAFPSVQAMRRSTDIEQNDLRKTFDQPVARDHLEARLDPPSRVNEERIYSNSVSIHFVHRLSDRFDFRFSHFDFGFDERIVVRTQTNVIISIFFLGNGYFRSNDRVNTSDWRGEKNVEAFVRRRLPLFATSHETSNNHLFICSAVCPLSRQDSKWMP